MIIKKSMLQTALEKVKPGLAHKEIIQQANSFAFTNGRVVTYNDEISISYPIPDLEIRGAIKAQSLYDLLQKTSKEEIEVIQEENQIVLKAGRAKAGFILEQEIHLPIEEGLKAKEDWKPLPKNLMKAFKFCHSIASSDMSALQITCVHIDDRLVEATDRFQIVRYDLEEEWAIQTLIPASAVREVIKYEELDKIFLDKSWAHFQASDGMIFSARTFAGEYPDLSCHFQDDGGIEFVFPQSMSEILERAQIFADNKLGVTEFTAVDIKVEEGSLKATTQNDSGWFEESAKVKHSGEPFSFQIGIAFLISILRKQRSCHISEHKISFAGDNWKHLVALTQA